MTIRLLLVAAVLPLLSLAAPQAAERRSVHVVRMVGDDKGYRFEPARLTIASGDSVIFQVASGQPHSIAFDTTAMAPATARVLSARMREQIAPLSGPLLLKTADRYGISFAGVPAGRYPFFCLPHLALQMKGEVTVQ